MNDGLRYARAIERAERARHDAALRTQRRRREIRENSDLTAEAKNIALRKLNLEGKAEHDRLTTEIERHHRRAREYEKLVRANRPVEDSARIRVERLLAQGLAYNQVIDRARELGDAETVAALRWEAMYHGDKHGFADASSTVAACDQALAQIALGDERDVNRGLVRIAEATRTLRETGEYSAKVQLEQDTPRDLLTVAYALGPREGDDDA